MINAGRKRPYHTPEVNHYPCIVLCIQRLIFSKIVLNCLNNEQMNSSEQGQPVRCTVSHGLCFNNAVYFSLRASTSVKAAVTGAKATRAERYSFTTMRTRLKLTLNLILNAAWSK